MKGHLYNLYNPGVRVRKGLLVVPDRSVSCTYEDRAFSVVAPKLWNSLPYHIRNAESVFKFKSLLKTHLYNS